MTRLSLIILWFLFSLTAGATTTQSELLIHFEKDKSILTPDATEQLDAFLGTIAIHGDYAFTVQGHTDSDGSVAYNEGLSLARATAVRSYLAEHGAEPELITVGKYGERDPLAANVDEMGMALNRRVRITFTRHTFADTEELRNALMEGSIQHFNVDPTKDQVITGAAGVELTIHAGSLIDALGRPVTGTVDLELTEALGLQAMVAHRLGTRSGNRLLETGGMLNVVFTDPSGNKLAMDPTRPLRVVIPAPVQEEGMELFLSEDGSDWSATQQTITVSEALVWSEPRYPMPSRIRFKFPVYSEDQKGKPMKPVEPMMPRKPSAPRKESYAGSSPWWSFLFHGTANRRNAARYEAALQKHEENLATYAEKVARFESVCSDYPDALARYAQRKAIWDLQKKEEFAQWKETVQRPAIKRYNTLMAPLQARYDSLVANWKAERQASMQRYATEADRTGQADIKGLNAYVFATSQLGWINCDRFNGTPGVQRSVIAQGTKNAGEQVYLVFTEIRSMLPMGRNAQGMNVSPPVPRSQPATVFAYAVRGGRPYVSMQPVEGSDDIKLDWQPSSFAEIGRLLKELGGVAV